MVYVHKYLLCTKGPLARVPLHFVASVYVVHTVVYDPLVSVHNRNRIWDHMVTCILTIEQQFGK